MHHLSIPLSAVITAIKTQQNKAKQTKQNITQERQNKYWNDFENFHEYDWVYHVDAIVIRSILQLNHVDLCVIQGTFHILILVFHYFSGSSFIAFKNIKAIAFILKINLPCVVLLLSSISCLYVFFNFFLYSKIFYIYAAIFFKSLWNWIMAIQASFGSYYDM